MRLHFQSRRLVFLTCIILAGLLAMPLAALADQLIADGDILAVGSQAVVNITVAPGATVTPKVSFQLLCDGKQHVDDGVSINIEYSDANSTKPTGGSLSATNALINAVPTDWPNDGVTCGQTPPKLDDSGDSTVTIVAPTTPSTSPYQYVVKYRPVLTVSDSNAINGTFAQVTFNVTVEKPTPTIAVTPGTFNYDGQNHPATVTVTGINGAQLTPTSITYTDQSNNQQVAVPVNAGTYNVLATYSSDSNYNSASGTGTLTINKATPVVSVSGGPFTYNGNPQGVAVSVTGVGGATVTGSGSVTYNDSSDVPINAGTYNVVATFNGDSNYNSASGTGTLTINKATPVVSVSGGPFTYNGNPQGVAVSVTGVGGATVTGSGSVTYNDSSDVPINAGTYNVVATFNGDSNYNSASGTGTLTINKATPVVSVSGGPFTYNGNPQGVAVSVTGVGGATVTGSGSVTYNDSSDVPINAGTYNVVATFNGDSNYNSASGTGTLTINKATPVVSVSGGPFTYNGNPQGVAVSVTGVGGATVTGSGSVTYNDSSDVPINAGTYNVVATFNGDSNYNSASGTGTLTINKATPVVSVSGGPFTYNGNPQGVAVSVTGVGGATVTGSGSVTYNDSSDVPINAGTYNVVATFNGDSNYNSASGTGTLTINKATLTVKADDKSITYGGSDPIFTSSYAGFVNSETASVIDTAPTCSVAGVHTDAGSYAIACSGGLDNNYNFSYVDGTLTVSKATLTVTANDRSITYGGSDPAFTITYNGFAYSDAVTDLDTAPTCGVTGAHANAGAYAIACSGGLDNNYNFSYVNGTLTVSKATLTVTANDRSITYGGSDPAFTITYNGFAYSDAVTDLDTAPTCGVTGVHTDAGSYAIACSGGLDNNYNFSYVNGTLTVSKATLTVTADSKSIYFGNPDPAFTFNYATFVNGETASVIDTPPTCGVTGDHAAVNAYPIACSGGLDNNYSFSYVKGTLTVMSWRKDGFFQPVDMTPAGAVNVTWNTVKNGSTVPLKFRLYAGTTELKDVSAVKPLTAVTIDCSSGNEDAIEELSPTGGTALRYDTTGGQFIYNWATPKKSNTCYRVTMTAQDDKTTIVAYFKLK